MSWNNITPWHLIMTNEEWEAQQRKKKMTDETLVLNESPSMVPDQTPLSDMEVDQLCKMMEEMAGKPLHVQTDEEAELV